MLFACTGKQQKDIVPSSKFSPYINAYTGGIVSQHSTIRIELTQEQPMVELNHELEKNPFRFSPSLKGKTYWADNRTLEFIPEEGGLKPGQFYKASFNLGDFIQTDKQLEIFEFSFRVQESRFSVQTEPLTITSPDQVTARGIISFSDVIDNDKAGKIIFTEQGQSAPLHAKVSATSIPTQYRFEITGIPRKDNDYVLTFSIDASTLSYSRKQEVSVDIPAKNSFRFMSAQRIQQPENGVEIVFSEPLSLTQDLQGLIEIPEIRSSAMQIKNNKVYLYIDNDYLGKLTVNLHEGIKSNQDKPLGTSHSIILSENNLKPQVEFLTQASDVAVCTAETNDVSSDRMKQIIEELNRQIESIADDFSLCLFLMEVNPIHELLVRELQEFSLCWEVSKTMKWGLRMNPQINSLKVTLVFNR